MLTCSVSKRNKKNKQKICLFHGSVRSWGTKGTAPPLEDDLVTLT